MRVLVGASLLFLLALGALADGTLVPTHVHLFLTGSASTLQVTFATSSLPSTSGAAYWPTKLPSQVTTIIASASDVHKFNHPNTSATDYITSVTLSALVSETSYSYYVFGDSKDSKTNSITFVFNSLPKEDSTMKIGIYGDLGAFGNAIVEKGDGGLIHWAEKHQFDFIVHNGDLAYNLASLNGAVGIEFLNNIEPVTSIIPYLVTPGNHEFMGDSEKYYKNWFLGQSSLGNSSGSSDPLMWYSFDVGQKLHIVMISTEAYCEDTDNMIAQYTWLQKDLAAVTKRSVQPWIIVFGHRQMYINTQSTFHSRLMRQGLQCTNSSLKECAFVPCKGGVNCGYSLEQLFENYEVDIFFAGHVHTYERMFPITSDLAYETQDTSTYYNPQHPVYIVSGAAGTESVPAKKMNSASGASPTAALASGHSFSFFQVYNDTHLSLDQIDVSTGNSVDSFQIVKSPSKPPSKTATFVLDADTQTACDQ